MPGTGSTGPGHLGQRGVGRGQDQHVDLRGGAGEVVAAPEHAMHVEAGVGERRGQ